MFYLSSVIPVAYLLGSLYPAPALTWTHVIAPSNSRDDMARTQDEHDLEGLCLRALGLGLTRLTGLGCITWRLGLA